MVAFAGSALAQAQPGASDPAADPTGRLRTGGVPAEQSESSEAERRDDVRHFLERQLERVRREEAALQEALMNLEHGEPLAAVRRRAAAAMGERAEERAAGNQIFLFRRRPGEGPDAGPAPRGDRRDTPPDPDSLLAFGRELNPGMFERIDRLRRESPEEFEQAFSRLAPRLMRMLEEKRRNPESWERRLRMWNLEREAWATARRARELPAEAQEPARARLIELGEEMFDLRLRSMLQHVDDLSNRLSRLRDEIAHSTSRRDELVRERVDEFMARASDPKAPGPPMLPGPLNDRSPDEAGGNRRAPRGAPEGSTIRPRSE